MAAPTYDARQPRYRDDWARMAIEPSKAAPLSAIALKLIKSKSRYEIVGKQLGIPWWFIAILHNRESSGDFAGVLHNGEKIIGTGRKTKLVPAGRGPFSSWEEAAVDALKMHNLHKIKDWPVERVCYEAERYNGWGYYNHGVPSAYLWSFSNVYMGGKYVADGVWSSSAKDQQAGVMPLLKAMMQQDKTITFGRASQPAISAQGGTAGVAAGAVSGGLMHWLGAHPAVSLILAVAIAAAVVALIEYLKSKGT